MPSGSITLQSLLRIMNQLARWERYSPVSLGMEDMFSRLYAFADTASANYPPYNIVKVDETTQELQVALAGFDAEDIEVAQERGVLTLRASKKEPNDDTQQYVHRGIAFRNVARNWQLADNAKVDNVDYTDGLLRITVGLEIPEHQRKVFALTPSKD